MKAATTSPHGNLRLLFWLMTFSTTGTTGLFRAPERGPELPGALVQSPHGDAPEGLGGHRPAHLGVPTCPLHELDRHLDDPQARPEGAEGEVGLEHVAGRLDLVEID